MEELLSKNSPDAAELIEKVESFRKVDKAKHLDFACDLFDLAQERGNEDLINYASCALGDACCQNDDFPQALYYLSAGVQGLAKTDEYQLTCRSYNELGIIFRSENHFITSEEYFINSIELARANRLYINEAIACSNFASLCDEMEVPQRALEYHYRAIECCSFIEDEEAKYELMVGDYAYIVKLYARLSEEDNMKAAFAEMESIVEKYPEFKDLFDIQIARFHYYRFINDKANMAKYREQCLKSFYECTEYVIYFDETKELIKIMLEERNFDELKRMFGQIEKVSLNDDMVNLRLYLENTRIQMYEALGDSASLLESLKQYYEFNEKKIEDNKRSFLTTLRLRSELAQQRTKNLFLLAAAETDPLTGIANRLKLNSVIDELFMLANDEGKNLAVEMMDVDCFKQVNDTFGHSKGDELLVALGDVLKSLVNEKIFVARYGGDEFIIYYYDMTDEEIIENVRRIKESMESVGPKLGLDNVTLSQGIVNHVPRPMNRAWDYMNAADEALYYVKNNGKANARLIHRASDLTTLEWEKVF